MTSANSKRVGIKPADWDAKLNEVTVNRGDLNRLVMDYLVVEGYREAAESFARESGMLSASSASPSSSNGFATGTGGLDFASIQNRMNIKNAIQRGDIVEAIERVNDLNPEILDHNPSLYFHLQQQRLIELIRAKKVDEALTFAQQELAPRGEEHPEFLSELEKTMTLLAYDVDITSTASQDSVPAFVASLLHPSHRQTTATEVNSAILLTQSHGPTPKLPNLLKILSWGEGMLKEKADFPTMETRIAKVETVPPKVESQGEDSAMLI